MNKTTIELDRREHIAGYGSFSHPFSQDSQSTLDALIEWSQCDENRNKRVYRHILRVEEENLDRTRYHYASEAGLSQEECAKAFEGQTKDTIVYPACRMLSRIPLCDEVYYLDIYWQ